MKKFYTICIVFCLSFTISHTKDTLTIVHFNDTHSCLSPGGNRDENLKAEWGGIARMATFIGMTKQANPSTIALHAGDYSIGDFFYNAFFGVPELGLLNSIGLDAMTVGNHEFDLTPTTLLMVLDTANISFPLLSANMIVANPDLNGLNNFIKPYTIKQVGNLKVGIFGLTTPEANILSQPLPDVFIDTLVAEKTVEMVTTLKSVEKCDVVILLSHLGLHLDQMLAQNIPGIDVIVGGHDHYILQEPVIVINPMDKDVLIVQAGAQYKYAGKLDIVIDNGVVEDVKYNLTKLDKNIPEEPNVAGFVNLLIQQIESIFGPVYSKKIGTCLADMSETVTKNDSRLTTDVGWVVSTAFKEYTGTEIGIEPSGSTAQPFYKGALVGSDVYRAISYGFNTDNYHGFRICTFKISGADLFAGLEIGLAQLDIIDDYLVQAAGLEYTYNMSNPPFSRVTGVLVNDEPIDPERMYTVTSNEMIPPMLEFMDLTIVDLNVLSGVSEYQVVVDWIHNKQDQPDTITDAKDVDIIWQQKAQVYPNPVMSNSFVISGNIINSGLYSVKIYDGTGRIIRIIEPTWFDSGAFVKNIDLGNLTNGTYYFELTNHVNRISGSFVIYR